MFKFRKNISQAKIHGWHKTKIERTQHFKGQHHKMVKHIQTIRWQIAEELFECVWSFCGVGA